LALLGVGLGKVGLLVASAAIWVSVVCWMSRVMSSAMVMVLAMV